MLKGSVFGGPMLTVAQMRWLVVSIAGELPGPGSGAGRRWGPLATPKGPSPVGTVAVTVPVWVATMETLAAVSLATYTDPPSMVTATATGEAPAGSTRRTRCVGVSMTDTVADPELAT